MWSMNVRAVVVAGLLLVTGLSSRAQPTHAAPTPASGACVGDNGGITLSPGFCATVFADKLGFARHMAVAPNGVVYVNTWSGRYYGNKAPHEGGFLVALQDTTGNGKANVIQRFGPSAAEGGSGGTGILLYKGSLYVEV